MKYSLLRHAHQRGHRSEEGLRGSGGCLATSPSTKGPKGLPEAGIRHAADISLYNYYLFLRFDITCGGVRVKLYEARENRHAIQLEAEIIIPVLPKAHPSHIIKLLVQSQL